MLYLKQSTAKVINFGPFVSPADGVTPAAGLAGALDDGATGVKLSKNGGALTIRHASVTATTYDDYGNYLVTLDATDTGALGTLRVQFADAATNLPVWADFMVLPANVYDSLVAGSEPLLTRLANSVAHGGNAATLELGANSSTPPFLVMNEGGAAVRFLAHGSNGTGFEILGEGSGSAMLIVSGGSGGDGLDIIGNGAGVYVETQNGAALTLQADASGHGLVIQAAGTSKHGVLVTGGTGGTSDGIKVVAGAGGVGFRQDVLTQALAESYSADGAEATAAQALYLIMQRLTEFAISGATITVNALDGATPVAALTLDSATAPTSSTRTA